MTGTVFDHVAVGTGRLADGWNLFGGLLGGRWVYGGDSPGYWWGQLRFAGGPKIELLTPTGGPGSAFLERFLASRGPGPHHLNFCVTDIEATLARVRALGIEPVGVNLGSATWKEAFVHPRDAYGTVIQFAQQSGPPPQLPPPAGLPAPGPPAAFTLAEQHVADLDGALRLFGEALAGEVAGRHDTAAGPAAELAWPNGARLRLVQQPAPAAGAAPASRGLAYLHFARGAATFSPADLSQAAELSHRLGVSLQLGG